MAIEKIIAGDSQEELIKQAGQMLQVFESRAHIKSAASRVFPKATLQEFAPPPGHFLSHMITMGSADKYGANRNADLWSDRELKKSHHTFVTHARNYREHKNQKPEYAIGVIKAARYDADLERGEVLMWTEIQKAAAEFERARAGEEQSGSMAASVEHDVCKCCGFISKYAQERCDHIRYTPGKWYPEFQKYAHMDNIGPIFKDYSFVGRPADRIAHFMNYLLPQEKAAAEAFPLRGDQLAASYGLFDTSWREPLARIAAFDHEQDHPAKRAAMGSLFALGGSEQFPAELLDKMAAHPYPARVLRSLQDRGMVMPLASFHSFVIGAPLSASLNDPRVKQAGALLPQVRARLLAEDPYQAFGEAVEQFEPSSCCCGDIIDNFLGKAQDQFALRYEALVKRALYRPTLALPVKVATLATFDTEAYSLACLYNAYLVKVAQAHRDGDWIVDGQLAMLR